jgi:hypothetical protein
LDFANIMAMNDDDYGLEPIGKHLFRVDGDTIFFLTRGALSLDELRILMDHYRRIRIEHGRLFLFFDSRRSLGIEVEARNYNPPLERSLYLPDMQVSFGAPFTLRVLISMLNRANRILRRKATPIQMFETEVEAWAFFEKERDHLRRELGSQK